MNPHIRHAVLLGALAWSLMTAPARADGLILKGGGELRGDLKSAVAAKVANGAKPPAEYVMHTLSGAMVRVAADQVESVVPRRPLLEEYETRRRAAPGTLDAQWELAEWCRSKSLVKERAVHLARVIEFDPEHVAAHRGLGHVKHRGRWTTRDEMLAARGYVKHKGRYVLPQELELIVEDERASDAEKGWFKKIKLWSAWLTGERPERSAEGLRELQEIRDADTVPALTRSLSNAPHGAQRLLLVEILTQIAGEKALGPLVQQSLRDESSAVRTAAVKGVKAKDAALALPVYIRALRSDLNVQVNRAAAALAQLGDETAVPYLIEALITKHQYRVEVPDYSEIGVGTDGSLQSGVTLPPNIEVLLRTGQLPNGVAIAGGPPVRMKEITIERDEQNPSVLEALKTLTEQNFGFDAGAWRRWQRAQQLGVVKAKARP
ncbi:MAG: HEAT repeat domain-containing protein [Planctomycetaceae bacterium]